MSPVLGGGSTLLGGGTAPPPPIGPEIGPHVPSTRAPLPPGKTKAQRDAEDAARLFVPVAAELLQQEVGGGDSGTGAAGEGDSGAGDSSGEGADGAGEGGSW